jgi:hypothetical protein
MRLSLVRVIQDGVRDTSERMPDGMAMLHSLVVWWLKRFMKANDRNQRDMSRAFSGFLVLEGWARPCSKRCGSWKVHWRQPKDRRAYGGAFPCFCPPPAGSVREEWGRRDALVRPEWATTRQLERSSSERVIKNRSGCGAVFQAAVQILNEKKVCGSETRATDRTSRGGGAVQGAFGLSGRRGAESGGRSGVALPFAGHVWGFQGRANHRPALRRMPRMSSPTW